MSGLFYFIFIFVIYSFLGWCLEEVFSYFVLGYFKKEGFLNIPFKPMYGTAATILVCMYEFLEFSKLSMIPFFFLVPTTVEYVSGFLLEKYFGKSYWDYKDMKYNFQGIICLRFSLAWIVLSALIIFVIQPIINQVYFNIEEPFIYFSMIAFVYIIFDFAEVVFENFYKKVP